MKVIRVISGRIRSNSDVNATKAQKPLRKMTKEMFGKEDMVPTIGGIVDLQAPHSEDLLPEEVILFEPGPEELFADGVIPAQDVTTPAVRFIFMNTPLTKVESDALATLRSEWKRHAHAFGDSQETSYEDLPEFVRLNALRILQFRKFDVSKSLDLFTTCYQERVRRLPLTEADVLEDLSAGAMYWHGRDRKCRPCLVIRAERMGKMIKEKERCIKLVLFVLEYGIRYAMVPGRIENWVVLIDLNNASSIVSLWQLPSIAATAKAIATTLECVYCCRMVFVKLLNMPSLLAKVVNGVIPAEKKKKVSVVEDCKTDLVRYFEPHQLEARYGGTQPDLSPEQTYPFHFYANCTGRGSTATISETTPSNKADKMATNSSTKGTGSVTSYHTYVDRTFHEGTLWERGATSSWLDQASASSLTPHAAEALGNIFDRPTNPCCTLSKWLEIVRDEVSSEGSATPEESISNIQPVVASPQPEKRIKMSL